MPDEPRITDLPEPLRAQAMERFAILRPFLEDGVALTQIATDQHLPLSTLHRWVHRYRATGLRGLVRQGRADKTTTLCLCLLDAGVSFERQKHTAGHAQKTAM